MGDSTLDPDVLTWLKSNQLVDAKGALSQAGYTNLLAQARKNLGTASPPADTELTASSDAVFTTFYASCGLPVPTGNDANVPSKWLTPDFRLKLFDAQAKAAEPKNFATVTQKKLGSGFAINGRWTDPTAKLVAANLLVCSKS